MSESARLSVDLATARRTMIDRQVRTFDVTDQDVIARMLAVPREMFLPQELQSLAYSDAVLHLATPDRGTRAVVPPLILARMIQAARVRPADRVLDLAGGMGYTAAILAGLADRVVMRESSAFLAEQAQAKLAAFAGNVTHSPGPVDAVPPGSFDVIFINGGVEDGLENLLDALNEGGRLVAIRMAPGVPTGKAVRFDRTGGEIGLRVLFDAAMPAVAGFRKKPEFTF